MTNIVRLPPLISIHPTSPPLFPVRLVHMGRGGEDSDNGMATHIIIDEVHERSLDSDLLCLVLKLMHANMPNLRLLLMSATLQVRRVRSKREREIWCVVMCACLGVYT